MLLRASVTRGRRLAFPGPVPPVWPPASARGRAFLRFLPRSGISDAYYDRGSLWWAKTDVNAFVGEIAKLCHSPSGNDR
jgi:hypothetical protein